MANKYESIMSIRLFANIDDSSKSDYGNSKWKPYKEGSPADITLRSDWKYSVKGFKNDDGSIGVSISRVVPYAATDNIADGVSQGGLKPIAQSVQSQHQGPTEDLDDSDIPFKI